LLADIKTGLPNLDLKTICVTDAEVSVPDAVSSYLFNSQLVKTADDTEQLLVAPIECQETDSVRQYLEQLVNAHRGIGKVSFFDLRESMRNGGGPACLRLRVVLDEFQQQSLGANVMFTPALHTTLEAWVNKHYRDRLKPEDLADPALVYETRSALEELSEILDLGSIYEFQQ